MNDDEHEIIDTFEATASSFAPAARACLSVTRGDNASGAGCVLSPGSVKAKATTEMTTLVSAPGPTLKHRPKQSNPQSSGAGAGAGLPPPSAPEASAKASEAGCLSTTNKRQRVEKESEEVGLRRAVKLSEGLRVVVGLGRACADEQELTRAILLEWAKRQGAVTEVNFVSVTVRGMGGKQVEVNLDDSDSTVKTLKRIIHDKQGVPPFKQQLFLLPKSVDNAEVNAAAIQKPMSEDELILVDCCVALCIDDDALTACLQSCCCRCCSIMVAESLMRIQS